MKRLCTINARGGSKGVPNKNLRIVGGHPLIAHSILQARSSGLFDAIAVSSDSKQILAVATEYDADVSIERPAEMATDSAPKLPAIRHCFLTAERMLGQVFDVVVDLDATAPLRLAEDIIGAVDMLERGDAPNVITGTPARRSPYFNLVELDVNGYVTLSKPPQDTVVRRQDAPECYDMNASIYAWWRDALLHGDKVLLPRTVLYEIPPERSIDIDSEFDFELVSYLMNRRNRV